MDLLKKADGNAISSTNTPSSPVANAVNFASRSAISFSLASEANGASLPAGSYHAKLQAGSTVLTHKFELR